MIENTEIQNYFTQHNYVVIKKFLSEDITNISYNYCCLQTYKQSEKLRFHKEKYLQYWDGCWGDGQIPGSFNLYGDPYFDSILNLSTNALSTYVNLDLSPEYSYWRFYQPGDILEKHKDRESCEISATICLGYNTSNNPQYVWPIFLQNKEGHNIEIVLNPGDMLLYKGAELYHWRDKFLGRNHAQVFFHYKNKKGKYFNENNLFDGRVSLGVPKVLT
jgi:hypothetical protein